MELFYKLRAGKSDTMTYSCATGRLPLNVPWFVKCICCCCFWLLIVVLCDKLYIYIYTCIHINTYTRYMYLVSERSERDTLRSNTIENRRCLFVCIYVWTYVCHFVLWPARIFVLAQCSTLSQTSLRSLHLSSRNWIVYCFEFFRWCS